MSKTKLKLFSSISLIFIIIGVIILSGCQFESKELMTLKENPVANLSLTKAREVDRLYIDKHVTFDKPVYAEAQIRYEPLEGYAKQDLFGEIINEIEKNGWASTVRDEMRYYSAVYRDESTNYLLVKVINHDSSPNVIIIITYR